MLGTKATDASILTFILAAVCFIYGCSDVARKQGDPNDKRYISKSGDSYLQITSHDFPDYAKFDGWIGRKVEVQPVYAPSDPSEFSYELTFKDFRNGQAEPVAERKLAEVGTSIVRENPIHLLCIKSCTKDGQPGIALRYYENGFWFGVYNHELDGDQVFFLPFPEGASSPSFGYSLDTPLNRRADWEEGVEIFHISLSEKLGESGSSGWGHRRFYLVMRKSMK